MCRAARAVAQAAPQVALERAVGSAEAPSAAEAMVEAARVVVARAEAILVDHLAASLVRVAMAARVI